MLGLVKRTPLTAQGSARLREPPQNQVLQTHSKGKAAKSPISAQEEPEPNPLV